MHPLERKSRLALIICIIAISIALNFLSLTQAIPETARIDSGCCAPSNAILARDFSAFYFGAWNLIHNPSKIYAIGSTQNASFLGINPHPETFKYLPAFLILISPFLLLSYEKALLAFDAFQFILLFLIAFLVFKIQEGKNIAVVGIVSILTLLLPFSTNPNWGISEAYFWQWAEGQSKVLEITLILLAFYFGIRKRPILSGIFFGLSFFDSRFTLVSIPLFLTLNKGNTFRASILTILTILLTNLPIFLIYPVVGPMYFQLLFYSGGIATPLYYYAYIPLVSILSLSITRWRDIWNFFSRHVPAEALVEPQHSSES